MNVGCHPPTPARAHGLHHLVVGCIATTLLVGAVPAIAAEPGAIEPAPPSEPGAVSPTQPDETTPAQQASVLRKRAEERYFADDHAGALADFQRAHELAPHATDLFNLGRIHEEMGQLEAAVARYEQFVEQPRIPLEDRRLAAERLEVLRVLVAKHRPSSAPPPSRTQPAAASHVDAGGPPAPRGRPLIVAGATSVGVGAVLALAGGLGFGMAARRASDRVAGLSEGRNPQRLDLTGAENLDARGKDLETLQIASLATGAAIVGIGAALLVTGLRRHRASSKPVMVPTASIYGMGVTTTWRF